MTTYFINTETDEIIIFSKNLGSVYSKAPWRQATEEETNAYLTGKAKVAKIGLLDEAKTAFCGVGFTYSGNAFCMSDMSTQNIVLKNSLPAGAVDRYKYYDNDGNQIDFIEADGWGVFFDAIMEEKDRVMRYYCSKKKEINGAETVEAVEAITIDFSE